MNQIIACWKRTSFASLACAVQLWTNGFWPTCVTTVVTREKCLSGVLVAGFEESERKSSEAYRKFGHALHCLALHRVVRPCGCRLHSACLAQELRVQVLCVCSESHRFCVYCGELPHEPVPCALLMELRKALEEFARGARGSPPQVVQSVANFR